MDLTVSSTGDKSYWNEVGHATRDPLSFRGHTFSMLLRFYEVRLRPTHETPCGTQGTDFLLIEKTALINSDGRRRDDVIPLSSSFDIPHIS